MEKKYKLTEETINVDGRTLHRIEALKDFSNVKKGDKGGFIENENNLTQYGKCWVYDNAEVSGYAMVHNNATVSGNAKVSGNAIIHEDAKVYGDAKVSGKAIVHDKAEIYDNAEVHGDAMVYENAKVYGDAKVSGNAIVYGDAEVCGKAEVCDNAEICGNAIIANDSDYIVFKNWWSSGRYFTWTKSNNMWKVGCFYGSGKQLINKAYMDSELSGNEYERVVRYVDKDYPEIIKNQQENRRVMTEQEIFEKLKEALDYQYMYDRWAWGEERKEVDNLEDYLRIIKQEREIEKDFEDAELKRVNTYKEFIHYLHDKAIGNKDSIIECFDENDVNIFIGYKTVTKKLIDGKLYLEFEDKDTKYRAEWQAIDNYAVWQTCGVCGDDYSGYLLFPTYKDDEYFVLWYKI